MLTDPQIWIASRRSRLWNCAESYVFHLLLAESSHDHKKRPDRRLALAMIMRIALLFSLSWIIRLTMPLFAVLGNEISGRDLVLIAGGLFLLGKSTHEIHQKLEGDEGETSARVAPSFASVIVQILLLDVVFSLDSVITAVGMVDEIGIMIAAVVVAVVFMMAFAGPISNFVDRRPTVKMLALSFLLLIGMTLMAEGFDQHIPKG